jgi:hypothetical protein
MVAKRKTRTKGKTRSKPVVPRVQPLLKCVPTAEPSKEATPS